MKIALFLLAALLAMAAAQTTSPAASGSPNASVSGSPAASPSSPAAASGSQFADCDTLLLNGTGNFDILLLGSESPSASGSPAASASGSPAASRSPGVSASPSLVNASPSLSRSPSVSAAAASPASSPSAAATASASPIISPSANTRLLDLASSLVGGRLAVNGNARVSNSILGGGLACLTSASPATSGSPAASVSGSPASSAAATRSPSASISGSPASSAAATRSPSASVSGSPAASPDFALLVTGNLEITNAQLACGGLAVGGSVSGSPLLSQSNAQNLEGSEALAVANSLDFASLRQRLLADSDELCSLSSTGQLSLNEFGGAVLDASLSSSNATDSDASSGDSSNVAIFNLPSSALANLTSLLINGTSANGFVIINIIDESGNDASSGSSSASSSNLTLSEFSTDAGSLNGTQLLWNFCNASRIDISNILLQGTILAPRASVSVNRAELEGALIAQSLIGNFFNHIPLRYQGVFCPAGPQSASASPSPSPAAQASASPSA